MESLYCDGLISKQRPPASTPCSRLPPGFRFHPTDEELLTYYLARKIADGRFRDEAITEVDLNQHEPWDLPGKAQIMVDEKEWYFYSFKDRKYPSGCRTNRATKAGYWKATGKDKEVFMKASSGRSACKAQQLVGMKKTLVFYKGRAPKGLKSNWVMHEYRMDENANIASMLGDGFTKLMKGTKDRQWVICRVFPKKVRLHDPPKKYIYSQSDDVEAEMLAATTHFLLADDERGRGGAAAAYTTKLPLEVAAPPLNNLADVTKSATTVITAANCSSSQLREHNENHAATSRSPAGAACEPQLACLYQERNSLNNLEDYSSLYAGSSSRGSRYHNGISSGGDFSYASFASGCASSDAWIPANNNTSTAIASTALPRFPSELESLLWLNAPAFLA